MELFATFVACICLVQVCLGAPAADASSSESSEYLTDADIAEMRSNLKDIPGLDSKSIDDFTNVVSKFRENATKEEREEGVFEIISLAILGPCEPKVDLKKLMKSIRSEESKEDSSSSEGISADFMKAFEEGLTPLVTPEQKNRAMQFLRAFRKGATEDEKHEAMLQLCIAAVESLRNTCASTN